MWNLKHAELTETDSSLVVMTVWRAEKWEDFAKENKTLNHKMNKFWECSAYYDN